LAVGRWDAVASNTINVQGTTKGEERISCPGLEGAEEDRLKTRTYMTGLHVVTRQWEEEGGEISSGTIATRGVGRDPDLGKITSWQIGVRLEQGSLTRAQATAMGEGAAANSIRTIVNPHRASVEAGDGGIRPTVWKISIEIPQRIVMHTAVCRIRE
jgi:hypothetical protein